MKICIAAIGLLTLSVSLNGQTNSTASITQTVKSGALAEKANSLLLAKNCKERSAQSGSTSRLEAAQLLGQCPRQRCIRPIRIRSIASRAGRQQTRPEEHLSLSQSREHTRHSHTRSPVQHSQQLAALSNASTAKRRKCSHLFSNHRRHNVQLSRNNSKAISRPSN